MSGPRLVTTFLLLALLGGCNNYGLRYAAKPQPEWARIYADYTLLQDTVGVSIDTDSRRIESVYIMLPDGSQVRPVNLIQAGSYQNTAVGAGGGVANNGVGFGTGVAIPVGQAQSYGLTTATFTQSAVGSPPWELHVKVQGIPEVVVPGLGGPFTAK